MTAFWKKKNLENVSLGVFNKIFKTWYHNKINIKSSSLENPTHNADLTIQYHIRLFNVEIKYQH